MVSARGDTALHRSGYGKSMYYPRGRSFVRFRLSSVFSSFFLSTRKRIYIVLLNNVFRSRKEDRTDEYLFLFFTNGKDSYIIFVYTSLYESFDFEKRGRNGLTNIYRLIVIIIIIIIQRRDDSTPMIEEGRGKGVYEPLWKLGLEPR